MDSSVYGDMSFSSQPLCDQINDIILECTYYKGGLFSKALKCLYKANVGTYHVGA